MYVKEGFPGQRLRVLSEPLVAEASSRPLTSRLLVTDAGYFPHATAHGRSRPNGIRQMIVIACVDGAGWVVLDGHPALRVESGMVAIIPAGTPHRYQADSADPWSIWWLHVQGGDADELMSVIFRGGDAPVFRPRGVHSVVSSIEEAVAALERDDTEAMRFLASGAAWRALSQLASDRLRGAAQAGDRIQTVQDFLRTHLDSSFTVAELAKLAGFSVSHFAALFKATAGIGVVEYVKRLRAAKACELLITTDATIAEIGQSIGYADAFYFSRQFRALNGISPSEFRQRSVRERTAHTRQEQGSVVGPSDDSLYALGEQFDFIDDAIASRT